MKKIAIWVTVILLLLITTVVGKEIVNEDKLKEDYYELIIATSELFKDHTQEQGHYYNRSYSNEEQIEELLEGKVTETGYRLVIESVFEQKDDLYVYKEQYQDYISDTRDFSLKHKDTNYYKTVRDTILNPALKLIPFEKLVVVKENNLITIEGRDVKVRFYEDGDRTEEHHQYARFGFPPKDHISFTLTFVYEQGKYLLEDFDIVTKEL
ncbi:hypothetical protein AWH56_011100 [Anaerobacillus isosaccharinicus]|uniref:Uncharacterized protein n=1 Tax=Anaerobacillus isosaccharinicus TaxID=1532552 RepID=A0A1S2MF76_9BACI|nr:hypothetical protein [Anaerobacillus isosaccharinicus]MBA5588524.1 hypothetical protein [Anaerobacillus isosaccharinicus]QOY38054.1 hypothetical protein AWH56_011100 [Anaerobacillus isosaccharinicus]